MMRLGPRALSLRELVALVVGSGGAGRSAEDIAGSVLRGSGASGTGPEGAVLWRSTPAALARVSGLGPAGACRLVAALELGRRGVEGAHAAASARIRGPEDVFRRMGPQLGSLDQEEFHALHLNTQHTVIREVLVTRGILDASLIHPREVFRPALEVSAAAVILVHNHPSGDPTPSAEDLRVTRQLREAGRILGVPVLDHVIVAGGSWRSVQG
jgi:DNA repair protein RadC